LVAKALGFCAFNSSILRDAKIRENCKDLKFLSFKVLTEIAALFNVLPAIDITDAF